jgi:hypothetical protein
MGMGTAEKKRRNGIIVGLRLIVAESALSWRRRLAVNHRKAIEKVKACRLVSSIAAKTCL